jgi:hypothetical protein
VPYRANARGLLLSILAIAVYLGVFAFLVANIGQEWGFWATMAFLGCALVATPVVFIVGAIRNKLIGR